MWRFLLWLRRELRIFLQRPDFSKTWLRDNDRREWTQGVDGRSWNVEGLDEERLRGAR